MTAIASLCSLLALLPGAGAIELIGGRRKAVFVLFGGILSRAVNLMWLALRLIRLSPALAIAIITAAYAFINACADFGHPAWTAMVGNIVPRNVRGQYFNYRNFAVNLSALLVVPLAGWLIQIGNTPHHPLAGYQWAFGLALVTGAASTVAFGQTDDPLPRAQALCWLLASSGGTRAQHALGAGIRARSPRHKSDGDRSTPAQP